MCSITNIPNELVKRIFCFLSHDDFISVEQVCKLFQSIIADFWPTISQEWNLTQFVVESKHKITLLSSCYFYCSAAKTCFPTLIIDNQMKRTPFLLKEEVKKMLPSCVDSDPLNTLQMTNITFATMCLIMKQGLDLINSYQMLVDANRLQGIPVELILVGQQNYQILTNYYYTSLKNPSAEQALSGLQSCDIYLQFCQSIKEKKFYLPDYVCCLIKNMSGDVFSHFCEKALQDPVFLNKCFVKKSRDSSVFLFKTEGQYIKGVELLKTYFALIRNSDQEPSWVKSFNNNVLEGDIAFHIYGNSSHSNILKEKLFQAVYFKECSDKKLAEDRSFIEDLIAKLDTLEKGENLESRVKNCFQKWVTDTNRKIDTTLLAVLLPALMRSFSLINPVIATTILSSIFEQIPRPSVNVALFTVYFWIFGFNTTIDMENIDHKDIHTLAVFLAKMENDSFTSFIEQLTPRFFAICINNISDFETMPFNLSLKNLKTNVTYFDAVGEKILSSYKSYFIQIKNTSKT